MIFPRFTLLPHSHRLKCHSLLPFFDTQGWGLIYDRLCSLNLLLFSIGNRVVPIFKWNIKNKLQERMRKIISEIQAIIPDVRYDTDRVIDNKSIMQLTAINEKLKKKVSADKEVTYFFFVRGLQRFSSICTMKKVLQSILS